MRAATGQLNDGRAALTARDVAEQLGVSLRHIRRMESAQMVGPRPFRLGRCLRYSSKEIYEWIEAGAPSRRQWEQIKGEER